jgi:hypothetical protein
MMMCGLAKALQYASQASPQAKKTVCVLEDGKLMAPPIVACPLVLLNWRDWCS